jgi:hypothetical protein
MGKYAVHRSDANAEELYDAARKLGMSIAITHRPTDAICGKFGFTVAVEVKTKTGKLEPEQETFMRDWKGAACVWRCLEDVEATHRRLLLLATDTGKRP